MYLHRDGMRSSHVIALGTQTVRAGAKKMIARTDRPRSSPIKEYFNVDIATS